MNSEEYLMSNNEYRISNIEVSEITSKKYDLDERLIDFAALIIDYVEELPSAKGANHLGGQLLRSGTSPALNYAEAQAAESIDDFIHKMKICLKELRESRNCLRILSKKQYLSIERTTILLNECTELIRIFVKSLQTAKARKNKLQ
ncbi:MAG: four helix bundle protein [Flavobacteriales bacterium]|nr:four helix bundle protein [Flavobacteriales bacterium]